MSADQTAGRTPWHLWVIGIVLLAWNGMGAFDYVMTQTQNEGYMAQFTPEQLEYFYGFPIWVVALWAIAVWGGVLGAVLLLLRSRYAMHVFCIALVSFVVTSIHNLLLTDGAAYMGAGGMIFTGIIFVIAVFSVYYAHRMTKGGLLR